MAEDDIEGLLARCGLGDRQAFARLYAAAGGKLYGVALRILGNRSDAEEAVQEAFVKIWHGAGRFQAGRGSAQGWLVSIARNQAIDALRARKAPARDISEMLDLADQGPTPEASAMGADERRRIEGCLGALPATGRRRSGPPTSRAGATRSWPGASRCRSTPCGPGCGGR